MGNWNGNKFSVYKSEEKSTLGLIKELGEQTNYNTDELEQVKKSNNKKVSYDDLHTKYQLTTNGTNANFNGSWQGLNKPTLSEEGAFAQVEKNMADIIKINEQLDTITLLVSGLKNENNFDNAPIINNYINLAIKKGISTIKLPSGTYDIYSSVIIPSTNVKLIIESDMRTTLILNGDIEGIVVDGGYTEDDYNTRIMNCNF